MARTKPDIFDILLKGGIHFRASSEDEVKGRGGDDIIRGDDTNMAHASTLIGRDGNDLMIGFGGADIINGGRGTDRVIYKSYGDTAVSFTAASFSATDTDTLWRKNHDGTFKAASRPKHDADAGYIWQKITTTDESNTAHTSYFAGIESFVIKAGGGDDTIKTGTGDDTIRGRDGLDKLSGGDGNDFLYGGRQKDSLNGGGGDDFLRGGAGWDVMTGGDGDDTFALARKVRLGVDVVTDWDPIEDKIQIDTANGNETTLDALKTAAHIKIVTGRDFSYISTGAARRDPSTNDASTNDVGIFNSINNRPLMILEDWTGPLDISHFDIV